MTKKYQVKVLDVDGSLEEESYTFQLKDNAIVEDLKVAFSKEDIYEPDQLHDRRIVLIYPLDVTSSIFTKQLRNRFGDYPKLYLVMRGGDI